MQNNIEQLLKELDLNTNEIKVCKACNDAFYIASEIAIKVQLNRTNTYAIIESLVKKRILIRSPQTKVNKYRTVSLSRLYDLLEEKKKQLINNSESINQTLNSLKTTYNLKRSPTVKFYNGFEDATKHYLSIDYNDDIKIITKFLRYANVGEVIDKKEIGEGSRRVKMIVPDNEESRKIISYQTGLDKYYQKEREFRFIDFKNIPVDTEIIIGTDFVAMFCLTETETWAIEFTDTSIINTFNALFTALWTLGKYEIIKLIKEK